MLIEPGTRSARRSGHANVISLPSRWPDDPHCQAGACAGNDVTAHHGARCAIAPEPTVIFLCETAGVGSFNQPIVPIEQIFKARCGRVRCPADGKNWRDDARELGSSRPRPTRLVARRPGLAGRAQPAGPNRRSTARGPGSWTRLVGALPPSTPSEIGLPDFGLSDFGGIEQRRGSSACPQLASSQVVLTVAVAWAESGHTRPRDPLLPSQAAGWTARARWHDKSDRLWRQQPSTLTPSKGGGDAGRSGQRQWPAT